VNGQLRAAEDAVDAAVPVDAKNAPTRDLENCTNRSFPQRPHRSSFSYKKKRKNEEHCKCANLTVSTEGFTPLHCARIVPDFAAARLRRGKPITVWGWWDWLKRVEFLAASRRSHSLTML
jgi:hypothetical protein